MAATASDIRITTVDVQTSAQATVAKITKHLWIWAGKCKTRRDAYWSEHYRYYIKNNWISIPLIVLSSLTSVVSVTNIGTAYNSESLAWSSTALAFGTSVLAALQRYFKYGERAEQCKAVAKNYTRIAYMIEFTTNLLTASPHRYEKAEMEKLAIFAETVRKDLELVINDTNDIPELFKGVADLPSVGNPICPCVGASPNHVPEPKLEIRAAPAIQKGVHNVQHEAEIQPNPNPSPKQLEKSLSQKIKESVPAPFMTRGVSRHS